MKKVLIMTVPRQDVVRPPGILGILAACCETAAHDYEIFDLNLHMFKTLPEKDVLAINADFAVNEFRDDATANLYREICRETLQRTDQCRPDYIAISVFTRQSVLATVELLKILQQDPLRHSYRVVLGGLGVNDAIKHVTGDQEFGAYALENRLTDHYISGEGEISFVEFLRGNLSYPGIDGQRAQQIMDLDVLPPPSYKKISPRDYFYSDQPEILVTGSKGCVRDCSFCDVGYFWKKYTYRRGDLLADDLYHIYQDTGVMKFDFSDSLINGSLKSFRMFNRRLIELQARDSSFRPQYTGQFICRPIGQMKERDYEEMKLGGAETLTVGIEHFSEHIRRHMRKDFDNAAIDWHFEQCARLNIKNMLLMISGYVTETLEDHHTNLAYLRRYRKYALSRVIYSMNVTISGLLILKGSPLYDMAHEIGLVPGDEDWRTWTNVNNLSLTPRERLRRGVEMVKTAIDNDYSVLHLNQRVEEMKRQIKIIEKENARVQIPIQLDTSFSEYMRTK